MKCTTRWINRSREWESRVHSLAAVGVIALAVMGIAVESSGGWITNFPVVIVAEGVEAHYGNDYAQTRPEVVQLRHAFDHIFEAKTKRTAFSRYQAVLAQREQFSLAAPAFDLLERHWPKLVNAIESDLIPTTNNATEQVIRIFTQHYKTFCGFESIDSARIYLAVFEKVYRFTPFSDDAQEQIRGKCPLEVTGYDVSRLPMADIFRGFALQWPAKAFKELVPNA
jgi:hypothetical protein